MSTTDLCAPLIITVSDTIPLDTGCDARSISDVWDTSIVTMTVTSVDWYNLGLTVRKF
jgi:hypothetical protein